MTASALAAEPAWGTLDAFLHVVGSTWLIVHSGFMAPKLKIRKEKEKTMKKILVLLACVVALALSASAQEYLNFADLPLANSPTPMPNGYGQLNWTNIFYVDPGQWSGAGSGYKDGPGNQDVAFVGGKVCRLLQEYCFGTISSSGGPTSFQAVSAIVAGGFGPTNMTVTAYNNGKYVGSSFYILGTQMQTLKFPPSWGSITQLVFQTAGGGNMVLYDLNAYLLGG
jgi:hypothetical protein